MDYVQHINDVLGCVPAAPSATSVSRRTRCWGWGRWRRGSAVPSTPLPWWARRHGWCWCSTPGSQWTVASSWLATSSSEVRLFVGLLGGCLTSQQHASVSQGRICSDKFTCCHTETEIADQTFYLTQSQYTDIGPTSPSADPRTPGTWQGKPLECQFLSRWYDSTRKNPVASGIRTRDLPLPRRTPYPLGQRGGHSTRCL